MADFKNRLKQAMNLRGIKQFELCQITDIPKSALSQYLSGNFKPKQSRVYLLAKALNVNEAWLIGFDVPMEKNSEEDIDLLKLNYNKLNILGKQKADEYVADLAENPKYTETTPKVVGITTPNITADIPQQPKKNNTQESAPSLSDSGNIAAFGAEETRPAKLKKANTTL